MSGDTLPGDDAPDDPSLRQTARAVLDAHWRPPGFCVPNDATYPWQWLWDSCFHAVCWAHLGDAARAVTELTNALAHQDPDGFVAHITYWHDGNTHAEFWGRPGLSSLTQPPMYGHAVAELVRLGIPVPDELIERARRGLGHLLTHRAVDGAGVVIVHPWESGCDDSPRWDAWCPGGWTPARWYEQKGVLVADPSAFAVASAGFNALVAFNARELAEVIGDATLEVEADLLAALLDARWDGDRRTWPDRVVAGPDGSSRVRTLDALLPVLVSGDADATASAFTEVRAPGAFGGSFGPAGVHRGEMTFDPVAYWRGPAWPQLTYLLWVAAIRRGRHDDAVWLASRLRAGAWQSGFAEYWHPDSGRGLGAIPQSWTALAAVVGQAPRA